MKTFAIFDKWLRMLSGKSALHVNQGGGKAYSKTEVAGYYNDLTEKVLNPSVLLDETGLVCNITSDGRKIHFPIAIFQYGLGAYDLAIMSGRPQYAKAFRRMVDWAMDNQQAAGAWDAFSVVGAAIPYSSMAQGEGASLLVRAYQATGDGRYLAAAKKAVDFMCLPTAEGGCAEHTIDTLRFKEYIDKPVVLNGWIFSVWGLYDYCKASNDGRYGNVLARAVTTLAGEMAAFDCGYWSKYDMGSTLASPFYHRLHIAQLTVMDDLFGGETFRRYAASWQKYQENRLNSGRAFIIKAWQKIAGLKAEKTVIVR